MSFVTNNYLSTISMTRCHNVFILQYIPTYTLSYYFANLLKILKRNQIRALNSNGAREKTLYPRTRIQLSNHGYAAFRHLISNRILNSRQTWIEPDLRRENIILERPRFLFWANKVCKAANQTTKFSVRRSYFWSV